MIPTPRDLFALGAADRPVDAVHPSGAGQTSSRRLAAPAVAAILILSLLLVTNATAADTGERLPARYKKWVEEEVAYIITKDERDAFLRLTNEADREKFIERFWQIRNPLPGATSNSYREEHYQRIAFANQRFGNEAGLEGWRTDRGRIFIKYGPPDEVLQRPQAGNTLPYEVWKYTRSRALKYVFLDQTQFGNYALIWTDDRREPSRPNWQSLLGPEAVLDVERF